MNKVIKRRKSIISLFAFFIFLFCLTGCFGSDDSAAIDISLDYSNVKLTWNPTTDAYYIEATISNSGSKPKSNVKVTYYYINQDTLEKHTKTQSIGTVGANSSVAFKSNAIYANYGISNYGISSVS